MAYPNGCVAPVALAELAAYRRLAMPFDGTRMFWGGFRPMVGRVR